MAHILIVEDDQNMSYLLRNNLEQEGYSVHCSYNGSDGWKAFNEQHFDLCVLDVMLPKQDGFTVAAMIRKKSNIPLLFLTARTLKDDIYRGFELGADDYITKPFTARELMLRIHAILRRSGGLPDASRHIHHIGNLQFDHMTREIKSNDAIKKLSTKENEVLRLLCESRNMVLSRNRILTEVWGSDDYFVSKSLDVYITRLRKLLSGDPRIAILNYHSIGYKMVIKDDIPASG